MTEMTRCGWVILRGRSARGLGYVWGCWAQLGGAIGRARACTAGQCARDGVCPQGAKASLVGEGGVSCGSPLHPGWSEVP
jgi:hypothetical protein